MKKLFGLFIVLVIFAGCAQQTGYVKRDSYWGQKYGCNDKKIGENEFAIIAEGNEHTPAERVAKLALYHAAHVARRNQSRYFEILQKTQKDLPNHELIAIPLPLLGTAPFLFVPVAEISKNEVIAILIIHLVDQSQATNTKILDAEQIINELEKMFEENK
jgi:hypothetical protein